MPLPARTLLPFLALALGSWVGVGAPHREEVEELLSRAATEVRRALPSAISGDPDHSGAAGRSLGKPGEAPKPPGNRSTTGTTSELFPTIDPSLLPDPTPWPQLNPNLNARLGWVVAEGPAERPGDGRRFVTFTFDDGPFPETTPVVLRVLAKHNVHATFFWIGRYLDGDSGRAVASRAVARDVAAAGHLVGNHTHDHKLLLTLSRSEQLAQIDDGASSIERTIGKRPVLFRPPYGQLDVYSEALLRDRGQTLVLWSVEADDMKQDDPTAMFESLREQLDYAGGGIVLLHDIRFSSADTLDKLLDWIDAHRFDPRRPERIGYEVVDLPAYLRAVAASPQPYATRDEIERARATAWRKLHPHDGVPAVTISEEPLM